MRLHITCGLLAVLIFAPARAGDVNITQALASVDVMHEGHAVKVMRDQNQENALTGFYAKTSRKCPPFCVHPMEVAPGVTTVGEVEVVEFMQTHLKDGSGMLIDARTPDWYQKGTIPGSINVPFTVFADSSFFRSNSNMNLRVMLRKFGVTLRDDGLYDFSNVKDLMFWCNGAWCDQSPRAIKGLVSVGYPAHKIYYYRGGMQGWLTLGFNTVVPASAPNNVAAGSPAVTTAATPRK